jgi:hypothetical protein
MESGRRRASLREIEREENLGFRHHRVVVAVGW